MPIWKKYCLIIIISNISYRKFIQLKDLGVTFDERLKVSDHCHDKINKLLTNKYDDNTVHLDISYDTRTRGHIKKLAVSKCHYGVRKYSIK